MNPLNRGKSSEVTWRCCSPSTLISHLPKASRIQRIKKQKQKIWLYPRFQEWRIWPCYDIKTFSAVCHSDQFEVGKWPRPAQTEHISGRLLLGPRHGLALDGAAWGCESGNCQNYSAHTHRRAEPRELRRNSIGTLMTSWIFSQSRSKACPISRLFNYMNQ